MFQGARRQIVLMVASVALVLVTIIVWALWGSTVG
jgi:hypothetical protein